MENFDDYIAKGKEIAFIDIPDNLSRESANRKRQAEKMRERREFFHGSEMRETGSLRLRRTGVCLLAVLQRSDSEFPAETGAEIKRVLKIQGFGDFADPFSCFSQLTRGVA